MILQALSCMAKLQNSRIPVIAFRLGMCVALALMILWYLASNSVEFPYDVTSFSLRNISTLNVMRDPKLKKEKNGHTEVYQREWESPAVRDANAKEKAGEVEYGEVPRRFIPVGIGSFLFTQFGAYRTGPDTFAVAGLGPTQLHQSNGEPRFQCSWKPADAPLTTSDNSTSDKETVIHGTAGNYYLPEKGFDHIYMVEYITLVVHCTFEFPVGENGKGGELRMIADRGEKRKNSGLRDVEFVALVEEAGDYINSSIFDEPFPFEYLYCGGPLYGSVSPRRMREWLSYHMRLFGLQASHFIFYDAGGIGNEVWKMLEPWVKMGRVSIMNVKQQARYDAHYFNQFLFANDCMFRAKTLASWAFFFDIDEYLHLTQFAHREESFHQVMAELSARGRRATHVEMEQLPMSNKHCLRNDENPTAHQSRWAIENLVYRRHVNHSSVRNHWRDFKSAIQAKYVLTMGVHGPYNVMVPPDMTQDDTITHIDRHDEGCGNCLDDKLHYYHFHGITVEDGDLCQELVDPQNTTFEFDGAFYEFDDRIASMASVTRAFELHTLGSH